MLQSLAQQIDSDTDKESDHASSSASQPIQASDGLLLLESKLRQADRQVESITERNRSEGREEVRI